MRMEDRERGPSNEYDVLNEKSIEVKLVSDVINHTGLIKL